MHNASWCDYVDCEELSSLVLPVYSVKTCETHRSLLTTQSDPTKPRMLEETVTEQFICFWSDSRVRTLATTYTVAARLEAQRHHFEPAVCLSEKAFHLLRRRFPLDKRTAEAGCLVGRCLFEGLKRCEEAECYLRVALSIEEQAGTDPSSYQSVSYLLSKVLIQERKHAEAERRLQVVIQSEAGELALHASNALAESFIQRGEFAEAEQLLLQQVSHERYPTVAAEAWSLLGRLRASLNRDGSDTEQCFSTAWNICKSRDEHSQESASAMLLFADYLVVHKKHTEAAHLLDSALLFLLRNGCDSFSTAKAWVKCGDLRMCILDYSAAIQAYTSGIDIFGRGNGDLCQTADATSRLASCLALSGNREKAQATYFQAIDLLATDDQEPQSSKHSQRVFEMKSATLKAILVRFAEFYCSSERTPEEFDAKAEQHLLQLLDMHKETCISGTIQTVAIKLCASYARTKRSIALENLHGKIASISPNSEIVRDVIVELFKLYTLKESQQYAEAEHLLQVSLELTKQRFPESSSIPFLHAMLAKLYSLQYRRSTKDTLKKYGFALNAKNQLLVEALILLENAQLHAQIDNSAKLLREDIFATAKNRKCSANAIVESLCDIGGYYEETKNEPCAEECFAKGVEIAKIACVSSEATVNIAIHLGELYKRTARLKQLEELYEDAALVSLIDPFLRAHCCYVLLGDYFFSDGQSSKAESSYAKALSLFREQSSPMERITVVLRLATLFISTHDIARTEQSLSEASSILASFSDTNSTVRDFIQNTSQIVRNLSEHLRIYRELESVQCAGPHSDAKAATECVSISSSECAERALKLSSEMQRIGRTAEAESCCARAFETFLTHPNAAVSVTKAAEQLSVFTSKYHCRIHIWRTALNYCSTCDPHSLETQTAYKALGAVYRSFEAYIEAISCYRAAYDIFKARQQRAFWPNSFDCLFNLYEEMEESGLAEQLLLEHIEYMSTDQRAVADLRERLISFFIKRGRFREAETQLDLLLVHRDVPQYPFQTVSMLVLQGDIYSNTGKCAVAEACYRKAVNSMKPTTFTSRVFGSVDLFFSRISRDECTESLFRTALADFTAPTDQIYCHFGDFYAKRKRLRDAEECYKRALQQAATHTFSLFYNYIVQKLAALYKASGATELQEALYLAAQAREDSSEHAVSLANFYYKQGNRAKEEQCLVHHLLLVAKAERASSFVKADVLSSLGFCYQRAGLRDKADICFQKLSELLLSASPVGLTLPTMDLANYWENSQQHSKLEKFRREFLAQEQSRDNSEHAKLCVGSKDSLQKAVATLEKTGKLTECESLLASHVDFHRKEGSVSLLAAAYSVLGDFYRRHHRPEAETMYLAALETLSHVGPTCVSSRYVTFSLAHLYTKLGRLKEAEARLSSLLETLRLRDPGHQRTAMVASELGDVCSASGHYDQAKAAFEVAYQVYWRLWEKPYCWVQTLDKLTDVCVKMNDAREAERWGKRAHWERSLKGEESDRLVEFYFQQGEFWKGEILSVKRCRGSRDGLEDVRWAYTA